MPAFLSAAVALGMVNQEISSGELKATSELAHTTKSVCGLTIALTSVTTFIMASFIAIRFLNIGLVNTLISIFLTVVSDWYVLVLAVCLFVGLLGC